MRKPPRSAIRAVKSGDWDDPETWGGEVPPDGMIVEIPEGIYVIYHGAASDIEAVSEPLPKPIGSWKMGRLPLKFVAKFRRRR